MTRIPIHRDFSAAARDVLDYLQQSMGFSLWMVTRTEGDDWIVLQALDAGYGVSDGDVFRWADSFCSRMVRGEGPQIAPRSASVPAYAEAPIGRQVPIGAYVGVPLERKDGSLFGTLCAIDPAPQPAAIEGQLPLVQLLSRLLSSVLNAELRAQREARRTERAKSQAHADPLTGLANRRGWDQLLAAEEARSRRYGHPACLFSIDLDELKLINDTKGHSAGDVMLRDAARILKKSCRTADVVARLGGDEFGILAVESSRLAGEELLRRLEDLLSAANIAASIGMVVAEPFRSLDEAWQRADAEMYRRKTERRRARRTRGRDREVVTAR